MAEQARYTDLSKQAVPKLARLVVPYVEAWTRIGRNEMVRVIDPGPARTGRVYYRPGTRTEYTASAPGEPPAIRTADYRDRWQVAPPVIVGQTVVGYIFNDRVVESKSGNRWLLGWLLDQGTENMRPRPHIEAGRRAAAAAIRKYNRKAG